MSYALADDQRYENEFKTLSPPDIAPGPVLDASGSDRARTPDAARAATLARSIENAVRAPPAVRVQFCAAEARVEKDCVAFRSSARLLERATWM